MINKRRIKKLNKRLYNAYQDYTGSAANEVFAEIIKFEGDCMGGDFYILLTIHYGRIEDDIPNATIIRYLGEKYIAGQFLESINKK